MGPPEGGDVVNARGGGGGTREGVLASVCVAKAFVHCIKLSPLVMLFGFRVGRGRFSDSFSWLHRALFALSPFYPCHPSSREEGGVGLFLFLKRRFSFFLPRCALVQ